MSTETWRVECEEGDVREVPVTPITPTTWRADGSSVFAYDGDARSAVERLSRALSWRIVAIIAPGQPSRAEVEADAFRRGADAMRSACADLCDTRAVDEGSNALQYAANAIRALPLPEVAK